MMNVKEFSLQQLNELLRSIPAEKQRRLDEIVNSIPREEKEELARLSEELEAEFNDTIMCEYKIKTHMYVSHQIPPDEHDVLNSKVAVNISIPDLCDLEADMESDKDRFEYDIKVRSKTEKIEKLWDKIKTILRRLSSTYDVTVLDLIRTLNIPV